MYKYNQIRYGSASVRWQCTCALYAKYTEASINFNQNLTVTFFQFTIN